MGSGPYACGMWTDPKKYWEALTAATADRPAPCAVVEAGAWAHNRSELVRRVADARSDVGMTGSLPIRVASKSIRVRGLVESLLRQDGFAGVLAFTLAEANWLVDHGVGDVVVGYPTADAAAISRLCADERRASAITLMVDAVEQLDLIDAVLPAARRPELRVALEVDVSYNLPGMRVGVYRSPVRAAQDARELAEKVAARQGFRLVGLMAYEAQLAGVGDVPSGSFIEQARTRAIQVLQSRSRPQVAEIRGEAVAQVREIAELEFVNGGGTGSIESTAQDESVTEIAAGSGLFGPGLFDHYRAFLPAPAAAFALDVVRKPTPDMATLLGGGWIASGPPSSSRLPVLTWPPGLGYVDEEMAGEVQTPLTGAEDLRVGDRVWLRHAKAGELAERVNHLTVVDAESVAVIAELPTYRGEGHAFL